MNIKVEILDYIKCNETTGALLLTGPWGCGKSYCIKQVAEELNRDKEAAVTIISLFGLDSISAINKRVKDDYTSFKLGILGKEAKKLSKGFATLAKDGLNVAGTAASGMPGLSAASQGLSALLSYDIFSFIEVQNSIGKEDNERKFVIVFDDLERCGINNKKDLLGVINDYVENKKIKVIVVADEEKINANDYKEYKEKLISRTIRMSANYDLMIENILKDYSEVSAGYRNFLIENQDLLKLVFNESKTYNVRIFKCILADFERIYDAWKATDVPTDNMKWVLYSFGAEVYLSKFPPKEEKLPEKQSSTFFFEKKDEQYSQNGIHKSSFNTIAHWIRHGSWQENLFVNELRQRYAEKDETPLYRFLTYGFWNLEQKDIDEGLPQTVQLAYDGKLSKDQLITFMGKVHLLRNNNISLPIEVDYSKIEAGFAKRITEIKKCMIQEPESHTFIEENDIDAEAVKLLKMINSLDEVIAVTENRGKLFGFMFEDSAIQRYSLRGLCVDEFDNDWLELFKKEYMEAYNSRKRELALLLLDVVFDSETYSTKENIQHTKDNFEKLSKYLESQASDDSITQIINNSFVRKIKNKIANIK